MKDITGQRFGRIVALLPIEERKDSKIQWKCICDCGNTPTICGKSLRTGNTNSCGCLQKEKARKNIIKFLEEGNSPNIIHGMAGTRIYQIWKNIHRRCDKKGSTHYERYGGRGITYDIRWKSFEKFYEDMKEGYSDELTIDRIDNNDNYYKENCRWVDMKEQANNRSSNHHIEWNGEKLNIQQWADRLKIPRVRINSRLLRGWSDLEAIGFKKRPIKERKGNIYLNPQKNKYEAKIIVNKKLFYLGCYKTEKEARSELNKFISNLK